MPVAASPTGTQEEKFQAELQYSPKWPVQQFFVQNRQIIQSSVGQHQLGRSSKIRIRFKLDIFHPRCFEVALSSKVLTF